VWTSAKGVLNNNHYEFGFGGTVRNIKNNGYTLISDGIIEKMGLVGGTTNADTVVNIVINGVDKGVAYSIMKPKKHRTVVTPLRPPLTVREGGVINFISKVALGVTSDG
jgi:hypothetical protein